MPDMMPEVQIAELLLEWANQAGYSKGIKFELGCAPAGTAPLSDAGDRWGIEPSGLDPVVICRWMGSRRIHKDVPSPFSSSWDAPPWTEKQKATFITQVTAAINDLCDHAS
jgi:hypothetical protein